VPLFLLPVPAEVHERRGTLALDRGLVVDFPGHREARLERAVGRLLDRLEARTGLALRGATGAGAPRLEVDCAGPGEAIQTWDEDESYSLVVGAGGARLGAPTPVGVLRGLETLAQLVSRDRSGWTAPTLEIRDQPRFRWRGLLLDPCRHFLPQALVHRVLDEMAAVKLNVLHWHLSDDQGFRIESRRFPKLHERGSDGLFYTQAQLRETIDYARDRGIRVVPELDVPGHTTAWLVGYPELGSAPGPYAIERRFGMEEVALDPTREEVYGFLDALLGELAGLFPDAVIHVGGDEVSPDPWQQNASIRRFTADHGLAGTRDLQAHFTRRLAAIVAGHGRRMMSWDEVEHPELPGDVIVQSWRDPGVWSRTLRSGHQGVLSWGYYLDHMFPASFHYGIDPLAAAGDLPPEARERVLGGEACMWTELASTESLEAQLWPRLAAIAERLWSSAEVDDVDYLYERLEALDPLLEELGSAHRTGLRHLREELAAGGDVAAVTRLAEALSPVEHYGRHRLFQGDLTTPLDGLADAVAPESRTARVFAGAVERVSAAPALAVAERRHVQTLSEQWRDDHAALAPSFAASPRLREAEPLSSQLGELARAGLEALGFLERGERPPAGWVEAQRARLAAAPAPDTRARALYGRGEPVPASIWDPRSGRPRVAISVVPAIARLVEAAAAGRPR
jgi:hexosaminidase